MDNFPSPDLPSPATLVLEVALVTLVYDVMCFRTANATACRYQHTIFLVKATIRAFCKRNLNKTAQLISSILQ